MRFQGVVVDSDVIVDVYPQPSQRIQLQQLVDQIHCFHRHVVWKLHFPLKNHLKNDVDVLLILPWGVSCDQLEDYDAECPQVGEGPTRAFVQHFGRRVLWTAYESASVRHAWDGEVEVLFFLLVSGAISEHACEWVFVFFFLLPVAKPVLKVLFVFQIYVFLQVCIIFYLNFLGFFALLFVLLFRLFFLFKLLILFLQLIVLYLLDDLCFSEIAEFDMELLVQQDVLWLQVSVRDVHVM